MFMLQITHDDGEAITTEFFETRDQAMLRAIGWSIENYGLSKNNAHRMAKVNEALHAEDTARAYDRAFPALDTVGASITEATLSEPTPFPTERLQRFLELAKES